MNTERLVIAILIIISIGVYANTLQNDFVYDDLFQVVRNEWIRDIRNIPEILTSTVWSFEKSYIPSNYYRPMMHIIYMVDYHIFGLTPWGFHLTNILFHSLNSVLVFLITSHLLDAPLALVAALLFATHPIHTEAVAWIGGIPDLTLTFFFLLAFYLHIKSGQSILGTGTPANRSLFSSFYLLSLVFYSLSLLSKEPAIVLPLLLMVYDYFVRKKPLTPINEWLKRYTPYLIVGVIYLLLRTYALGGIAPLRQGYPKLNNFQYFINVFPLLILYLKKLILPTNLNAFYTFHPVYFIFEIRTIFSLALAFFLISFLYWVNRTNEKILFVLLWIIIPLAPVLYIPVLGKNPFTERYLYLSSVGFVILVSMAIKKIALSAALNSKSLITFSIALPIIILYSAITVERNSVWKDEYTLWTDTVKKSPDSSIVHYNLGIVYAEKKLLDEAINEFKEAIKISPNYADAYYNLGLMYDEKGLTDLAIAVYEMTVRLDPKSADAHYNLGLIYLEKSLYDQALYEFREALRIKPDYREAQEATKRVQGFEGSRGQLVK